MAQSFRPAAAAGKRLVREGTRRRRARTSPRCIERYLSENPQPKLHLGAGHNRIEGWLNTDRDPSSWTIHLDATARFPFADETFAYIFSEHLIEHLSYPEGVAMLKECQRVLRPGGRIRMATPDLGVVVGLLDAGVDGTATRYARWLADSYFPAHHGPSAAFAVNQVLRGWGHRFVYDEVTLRAALEGVGFVDLSRHAFGHSADPVLSGLENHGVPDGNAELSAFETMVVEASKP